MSKNTKIIAKEYLAFLAKLYKGQILVNDFEYQVNTYNNDSEKKKIINEINTNGIEGKLTDEEIKEAFCLPDSKMDPKKGEKCVKEKTDKSFEALVKKPIVVGEFKAVKKGFFPSFFGGGGKKSKKRRSKKSKKVKRRTKNYRM